MLQKLLIVHVHNSINVDIVFNNLKERTVSLGLCFTLSLILVSGSVFSSSFTLPNNAFAADMPGGSMDGGDNNQGGSSGNGDGNGDDDNGSNGDAPLTTGALTAGGDSDNDEDDDESSGGNRDSDNDNDDDEPASKNAPQTADTVTANKPDCPKGQEYYLFSASCKPVGGPENPGNTGPANPTPTSCFVSYNPEESDLNLVWGMKKEQLMKINRGVFYYAANDEGMQQQQLSLLHQVQENPVQLGKKYDPSSILSAVENCTIKQVRNPDGSITATITRPDEPFKDIIKTDTTGKVVVQENRYDNNDKLRTSAAIDNNRISTRVQYDDGGPGKNSIDITDRGGIQVSPPVWWKPDDGSVQSIVSEGIQHDDDDNDPTTATTPYGTKTTVKPFNVIDPYYIDVRNPDGSLKIQMILNSDGTVEPGFKWTTPAPVEPANK